MAAICFGRQVSVFSTLRCSLASAGTGRWPQGWLHQTGGQGQPWLKAIGWPEPRSV